MKLPDRMWALISERGVKVLVGYPWWLRPWLARNVVAITLGHRVYLSARMLERSEEYLERLLRHELAHVAQVKRLGLLPFLWSYVTEFLRHYWRVRSVREAYLRISFEVEAASAEEAL